MAQGICAVIFLIMFSCLTAVAQGGSPLLISPTEGEVMDNGCQDKSDAEIWIFKWGEVPGAKRYHLQVRHQGSRYPAINDQAVDLTSYAHYGQGSYVAEHNRTSWNWRVRGLVNGEWSAWSDERTFIVEPLDTDCVGMVEAPVNAALLRVPAQVHPPTGAVFSRYPRETVLLWEKVLGAASYTIEIDCFHCCRRDRWCTDVGSTWRVVPNVRHAAFKAHFVGAQPGRWRVWAVGADGEAGPKSKWSEFRYTR